MATKKYVSLEKLTKYDELIKAKIAADDATTLASAKSHAEAYADSLAVNYDVAGAAAQAKSDVIGTSADESSVSTVYGIIIPGFCQEAANLIK